MDREPTEKEKEVGAALREECLKVFGSTWSNDVAWQFSRAAIRAMREPTAEMEGAMAALEIECSSHRVWVTGIDAASPPME